MLHYAVACLFLLLSVSPSVFAQSTSPWKKVADTDIGDSTAPSPGASYMTVYVRAATVYQMSNWWTRIVERNRQSVLTISLDGTVAGIHFSQTKVGDPIELRRIDSMVDLGYSGVVIERLPTTFSGMTFSLQINKTSKDGLNDLISMASDMSKTQPPTLSITQQQLGVVSLSKSLADYLFGKHLLVKKLSTQSAIPSTGLLHPGIYACLAADSNVDYARYLAPGNPGLHWDGTQLTYNNAPVQRISYFIVEVGYQSRFFAKPLDALSYGGNVKPWVSLYLLAEAEVPKINSAAEASKIRDEIQSHLGDARMLLDADYDFIAAEKNEIANAVHDELQKAYTARLQTVVPDSPQPKQRTPPGSPTPTHPTPPPPSVLWNEEGGAREKEAELLRQIERNTGVMGPTIGVQGVPRH